MLPVPKDPYFKIPECSEEEFFNPKDEVDTDAQLLKTGAWDDVKEDDLKANGEAEE